MWNISLVSLHLFNLHTIHCENEREKKYLGASKERRGGKFLMECLVINDGDPEGEEALSFHCAV